MASYLTAPPMYEELIFKGRQVERAMSLSEEANEIGDSFTLNHEFDDDNKVEEVKELIDTAGGMQTSERDRSSSISSSPDTLVEDLMANPPSYTPALNKSGILLMKPEFTTPFSESRNRNWRKCVVEVNNTQLRLTQFHLGGLFSRTEVLSLQFAEVGLASDYDKRPNSFRLRIESRQLMFHCKDCKQMLSWLVSLQMGISLALPLELRQLPEEIKRRRSRERDRERRRLREQRAREAEAESHAAGNQRRVRNRAHSRNDRTNIIETSSSDSTWNPSSSRGHAILQRKFLQQEQKLPKWQPTRRQSRFSEKDFPHLTRHCPWEGRSILYQGQWAQVQNRRIIFVLRAGIVALNNMNSGSIS